MTTETTANLQGQHVSFLKSGTVVNGRYVIEGVLGSGGMGNVYRALDQGFPNGRTCAIKETPTPEDDPPTPQQLIRVKALRMEADIMSKLTHDAIPKVYDLLDWQRRHYLVMEHIDGETLNDKLKRRLTETGAGFDEAQVIHWALDICDLFEHLHTRPKPIIHRDCKPDNFIITRKGQLKMIDFGIARRLEMTSGERQIITALGAHGYAAPESYQGYGDPRTDIYSLGAMMHALLTGHDPQLVPLFEWSKFPPTRYRPTLSREFENVIMRCLRYEMHERWPSARDLRLALTRLKEFYERRPHTNNNSDFLRPETVFGPSASEPLGSGETIHNPLAPAIAWSFETQAMVRSSPKLYHDRIYFGSHDATMYCLDLRGEALGSFVANGPIVSDPVITERSVFFGTEAGNMYAVNHDLTRKQWSHNVGRPILSTPTLLDDLVVIGASDRHVYAFPQTGHAPVWNYETPGEIRGELATINGGVVFGSHDHRIYGLDAEGQRRWWRTTNAKVEAMPVTLGNLILIGGMDQYLYAIDAEQGTEVWRIHLEGCIITAVATAESCVYVGSSDGRITCLDARRCHVKWRHDIGSQITSDVVMRDHWLYFGCANGALVCFDTHKQAVAWRHQAGDAIVTRPLLVAGLVIVGSLDHRVYALVDHTMPGGGR